MADPAEREDRRQAAQAALEQLKGAAAPGSSLEELVDAFAQMCALPIEGDAVLFETGRFSFTGEKLFYVSLVRQFPDGTGEYCQLHMDVLYRPERWNRLPAKAVWSDRLEQSIFTYIRASRAFARARRAPILRVDVFLDETT